MYPQLTGSTFFDVCKSKEFILSSQNLKHVFGSGYILVVVCTGTYTHTCTHIHRDMQCIQFCIKVLNIKVINTMNIIMDNLTSEALKLFLKRLHIIYELLNGINQ